MATIYTGVTSGYSIYDNNNTSLTSGFVITEGETTSLTSGFVISDTFSSNFKLYTNFTIIEKDLGSNKYKVRDAYLFSVSDAVEVGTTSSHSGMTVSAVGDNYITLSGSASVGDFIILKEHNLDSIRSISEVTEKVYMGITYTSALGTCFINLEDKSTTTTHSTGINVVEFSLEDLNNLFPYSHVFEGDIYIPDESQKASFSYTLTNFDYANNFSEQSNNYYILEGLDNLTENIIDYDYLETLLNLPLGWGSESSSTYEEVYINNTKVYKITNISSSLTFASRSDTLIAMTVTLDKQYFVVMQRLNLNSFKELFGDELVLGYVDSNLYLYIPSHYSKDISNFNIYFKAVLLQALSSYSLWGSAETDRVSNYQIYELQDLSRVSNYYLWGAESTNITSNFSTVDNFSTNRDAGFSIFDIIETDITSNYQIINNLKALSNFSLYDEYSTTLSTNFCILMAVSAISNFSLIGDETANYISNYTIFNEVNTNTQSYFTLYGLEEVYKTSDFSIYDEYDTDKISNYTLYSTENTTKTSNFCLYEQRDVGKTSNFSLYDAVDTTKTSNFSLYGAKNTTLTSNYSIVLAYSLTSIDGLEFDTTKADAPKVFMLDSTHCVVAYVDNSLNGIAKIYSLDSSADNLTLVETYTFASGTANGYGLSGCKIDDTHFILNWSNEDTISQHKVATYSVNGSYDITLIDSEQYGSAVEMDIVLLDSTHFISVVRAGIGGSLHLYSYELDGSYNLTRKDYYEAISSNTHSYGVIRLNDTHFAVTYTLGSNIDGYVATYSIDTNDDVDVIDTLQFATSNAYYGRITSIDSTHFAVISSTSSSLLGSISVWTFSIDGSYNITEQDEVSLATGTYTDIISLSSTELLAVYNLNSPDRLEGKILTVDGSYDLTVEATGTIYSGDIEDSPPRMVKFDSTKVVLVYPDTDFDGQIKTLKIIG